VNGSESWRALCMAKHIDMIIYDYFYCVKLNLFTYQPHMESDGCAPCCQLCILKLDKKDFRDNSWLPHPRARKVFYTLNGEHWIIWSQA